MIKCVAQCMKYISIVVPPPPTTIFKFIIPNWNPVPLKYFPQPVATTILLSVSVDFHYFRYLR